MPVKAKGPRLYLRNDKDGRKRWIIRDGARQLGTGCSENERLAAEVALQNYISGRPEQREFYVYFITARAPDFPIKIGITENRLGRLSSIQTALPYDVEVLAIAKAQNQAAELALHKRFSASRLRGEWFERTPELMQLIEEVGFCDGSLQ